MKRRLVGVELDGEPLSFSLEDPWPVYKGDKVVGRMTRAAHSPRLQKNIGFANVPTEKADLGTKLIVETPAGKVQITVVPKPFFAPKKTIS